MTDLVQSLELLNRSYQFPINYTFKFIVLEQNMSNLLTLLNIEENKVVLRKSKNGNYCSLTMDLMMENAEAVLRTYQMAKTIKGVVCL